ncbi:MAG: hypothetical protein ACFFDJ_10660 [Candidatus Odinarchaeota archaeon]
MVFCPFARGDCQGRVNCRIWIRGRIHNTDTKLLAAKLARFVLHQKPGPKNPQKLTPELTTAFWETQRISNISREVISDRYLREKVFEVEEIATQWLASPGFQESVIQETLATAKEQVEPRTQRCKSPP